ncbi:MAG TPA: galactose oxidase-like domain-containing protein [Solirubrobacteraceae bacterium]|nr:galactose oxidase-like domain-containing protein [Solirubrobacteraceae bacterium]
MGQWGPVLDWGVQGKHMALVHTGKVVVWSTGANARIWNPETGSLTSAPAPFGDIHCAGQVTLADGRLLVAGGQNVNTHIGIKVTSIFDPLTSTWTKGADMAKARWYPTVTTLPDGRALVTSGDDQTGTRVTSHEIYDPVSDTWTNVTSRSMGLYPFMYVLPNGKVYEAGTRTSTAYLTLGGSGTWSSGPTALFGSSGYAESGAMYAPGKILRAGGGDPAFARTQIIDTTAATPRWEETAAMAFPRRRMNTPILADGSIMAVGGTRSSDSASQAILDGEIWNPATKTWKTVASMAEPRMYHSTALMLPDGRVVTAGGEAGGRLRAQIYSPPYLFKGTRPTITSAPSSTEYGATFTVGTDATNIAKVALMRPSAVTHAIDMNQRYVPLTFSQTGSELSVTAPPSANHAPPGFYMLIVTNSAGVPSVAKWVKLGGGTAVPPPPPPPTGSAPTANFTASPTSGTAPLAVQFTDTSTGSPTSRAWDFQNDGTVDSTATNPSFTYSAAGTYTVKLTATNANGSDDEIKTGLITVSAGGGGGTPGTPQTFNPIADAQIRDSSPNTNYGTLTTLRLRLGNTSTPDDYRPYLKFNVTGLAGAPASAKLRLFVTDASADGGAVAAVGNGWTETGITWNNAPPIPSTPVARAGPTTVNTWKELDVTSAVTGNGEVSFALTTTSSDSQYYASREATTAANRPQLVVTPATSTTTATQATTTDSIAAPAIAGATTELLQTSTIASASDPTPPATVSFAARITRAAGSDVATACPLLTGPGDPTEARARASPV